MPPSLKMRGLAPLEIWSRVLYRKKNQAVRRFRLLTFQMAKSFVEFLMGLNFLLSAKWR